MTRQFQIFVAKDNTLQYQTKDVVEVVDSSDAELFTDTDDNGKTNYTGFALKENGWVDVKVKSQSGDTFAGWSDGEKKETRRITYSDATILFANYWTQTPTTATPVPSTPVPTAPAIPTPEPTAIPEPTAVPTPIKKPDSAPTEAASELKRPTGKGK